jgi:acyl-[acyl-carrier-protein]-phospholipid O-acyltransferase/long-chain-fatty-acid--[acyl-carrier-protein] ligase
MIAARASDLLAKAAFRLVARTFFRIRIEGIRHVPSAGPALLVSNHVTHLDAFLIGAAVGPVVRFLAWKPYYDNKLLTWGFRIGKAIPIGTSPRQIADAIEKARHQLSRGEVVCIFAEGSISRTGDLLPFKRGLEAIACGMNIPIIPVHLGGLWESIFSYQQGPFIRNRPRRLRHPVVISFGKQLPASAPAAEVRRAVQALNIGGASPRSVAKASSGSAV